MERNHVRRLTSGSLSWHSVTSQLFAAPALAWKKARAEWRMIGTGLLLWAVFFLFLALVQFSTPDLPDNDGYYHIKMAYLMRTEGLKPAFPWLPLSILNAREFYDHHFLFHVALIPFTFDDLRTGGKWAAAFFASLAFLSTWNLFKNQRIPYAALWAVGLVAVSEAFIFRMSIIRAQSLSLAVLMLGLDMLLRKKNTQLAFLSFVYVWLYDAFPLLVILAGVYTTGAWLAEQKLDVRPLVYSGAGIILGLLINPYFPYNIVFAVSHILPKIFETTAVSVGNEWYPYTTAQLLKNSPLAIAAFISGTLALGWSGKKMDLRTLVSFALACLFGLMLFQSRRFVEYFPPFALVFAAFAWAPIFQDRTDQVGFSSPLRKNVSLLIRPAVLALLVILGGWVTFVDARSSLQSSKPFQTYAGASAWLAANTPSGARVFQTDWDDFPRLFYYNTHNTYLIGLDPTYMLLYDAGLYEQWVEITRGKVDNPSTAIRQNFGARYIVTDLRHKDFLQQAEDDPGLKEMYRDGDAVVFQVSVDER